MATQPQTYQGGALAGHLARLPEWRADGNWLVREYRTDGWRSSMLIVNLISYFAVAADHHPDLEVHWGSVVVRLQTHTAGGITDKDLQLAAQIESSVAWRP